MTIPHHQYTRPSDYPVSRIVRMRELKERLGLSASHIYALIVQGRFPKPFPLIPGGRAVGWLEADVAEWIDSRKAASQGVTS